MKTKWVLGMRVCRQYGCDDGHIIPEVDKKVKIVRYVWYAEDKALVSKNTLQKNSKRAYQHHIFLDQQSFNNVEKKTRL